MNIEHRQLRDKFAGMALMGMLASETTGDGQMPAYEPKGTWFDRTAEKAYDLANAMVYEKIAREDAEDNAPTKN